MSIDNYARGLAVLTPDNIEGTDLGVKSGDDITLALATFLGGTSGTNEAYIGPGTYYVSRTGPINQTVNRRLNLSPRATLIYTDSRGPGIELKVAPVFTENVLAVEDSTTAILDNPVDTESTTITATRLKVADSHGLVKDDLVKLFSLDIVPHEN